ncbi:MAG: hypothetical protein AAGU27_08995 [Dehalobacterium sp.]
MQKLKWVLFSFILSTFIFGIYIIYQTQIDKKIEDKPTEVAQSVTKDYILIEKNAEEDNTKENDINDLKENSTIENNGLENSKKEDEGNKEEVITEESTTARKSEDLASRGATATKEQDHIPVIEKKEEIQPEQEQSSPTSPPMTPQAPENDTTLNNYVLDVIKTYAGGYYPYLLNNDYANYNGVTENLCYQDKVLSKANPAGNKASFCSGITFEAFFKAMQKRNKDLNLSPDDFNGMSYDQLFDFMLIWYVANGNKKTNNVSIAVEKYGIGKSITNLENARAGDFIDISREDNSGHTVVFLNWLRDESGRIIGLKYWSSQESTNGISEKEEYFNVTDSNGKKYGSVLINMVYIARVL